MESIKIGVFAVLHYWGRKLFIDGAAGSALSHYFLEIAELF